MPLPTLPLQFPQRFPAALAAALLLATLASACSPRPDAPVAASTPETRDEDAAAGPAEQAPLSPGALAGESAAAAGQAEPDPGSIALSAPMAGRMAHAKLAVRPELDATIARHHDLPDIAAAPPRDEGRERYEHLSDNPLRLVAQEPVSTFSLDVDTGSYSNVRRFLSQGRRPPEDAVRVEEFVNYFPYEYPRGSGEHPFGVRTDLAACPWNPEHWLLRVAVRADDVAAAAMPPANLVFLVDVSGSMDEPAKLPLLRQSLELLAASLRAEDRVSLVVYAGREAVVLEPTPGDQRAKIESAIDSLQAGGSTAGEAGIRLAYRMARQGFVTGGINRVLLATDGDFNVGITDFEQLLDLAERERESGVQISTLGFGAGNYNERLLERLADAGNGSYAYIDTLAEGRKVLVDQVRSTLVTVARDAKVQVEFNPAAVAEYRLIGYENRMLAREDFANDRVDAGEIGAGQTVTALYELTPVGATPSVDPLRYDSAGPAAPAGPTAGPDEVAFVKLRYKRPTSTESSRLLELPVSRASLAPTFEAAGDDLRFAAAVAGFGQLLRGGRHTRAWTLDDVLSVAGGARGRDEFGYRAAFLDLVRMAKVAS